MSSLSYILLAWKSSKLKRDVLLSSHKELLRSGQIGLCRTVGMQLRMGRARIVRLNSERRLTTPFRTSSIGKSGFTMRTIWSKAHSKLVADFKLYMTGLQSLEYSSAGHCYTFLATMQAYWSFS